MSTAFPHSATLLHPKSPFFTKVSALPDLPSQLPDLQPTKRALLPLSSPIHRSKRQRTLEVMSRSLKGPYSQAILVTVKKSCATPVVERLAKNVVLGYLHFERDGKSQAIIISSNTEFIIGRRYDCDLVIPSPLVSKHHLRVFAIITDTFQTSPLICLSDSSSNGFKHNGYHRKGRQSIVLTDGDVIEVPGTKWVFRFSAQEEDPTGEVKMIGGYKLLNKVLGSGGNGIIQLAENLTSRRQVACKMIKLDKTRTDAAVTLPFLRAQIQREIRIGMRADHANVIKVLAEGDVEGEKCVFVELIIGGDLFAYIAKHGALLELETKFFAYQLMLGLKYLHDTDVAHGDIKTENILLVPRNGTLPRLVIADFGHAFEMEEGKIYREARGTMSHLCPEAVKSLLGTSVAGYDPTIADAWALAIVIYKCLLATEPFDSHFYPVSGAADSDSNHMTPRGILQECRSSSQRRCHKGLNAILTAEPAYMPQPIWTTVSDAGQDLIRGMFQRRLKKRITLKQALDSRWIVSHKKELNELYEAVVTVS